MEVVDVACRHDMIRYDTLSAIIIYPLIFNFARFYGPVPMGLLRGKVCFKVHVFPPFLEPVASSTVMLYRNGPEYSAIFGSRNTFALTKEVLDNLVSDSPDSEKNSEKIERKSES